MWFRIICLQSSLGKHKFKRFPRERLPLENLLESKLLFLTERKGLCKCKGNTDPAKALKNIRLGCVSSDITFIHYIFGKIRRYYTLVQRQGLPVTGLLPFHFGHFLGLALLPFPQIMLTWMLWKSIPLSTDTSLSSGLGHTEEAGLLLFPFFPTPQMFKGPLLITCRSCPLWVTWTGPAGIKSDLCSWAGHLGFGGCWRVGWWTRDIWGIKLNKSPVVLLCCACFCRELCGDFPVSIPFMVLIFQSVAPYFWQFSCFWVEKAQCPCWPP